MLRRTMRKWMQAKLQAVKEELRRRRHATIGEQAEYLRAVVQGHRQYYGVPGTSQRSTRSAGHSADCGGGRSAAVVNEAASRGSA